MSKKEDKNININNSKNNNKTIENKNCFFDSTGEKSYLI
jgi:hypothetical protein